MDQRLPVRATGSVRFRIPPSLAYPLLATCQILPPDGGAPAEPALPPSADRHARTRSVRRWKRLHHTARFAWHGVDGNV